MERNALRTDHTTQSTARPKFDGEVVLYVAADCSVSCSKYLGRFKPTWAEISLDQTRLDALWALREIVQSNDSWKELAVVGKPDRWSSDIWLRDLGGDRSEKVVFLSEQLQRIRKGDFCYSACVCESHEVVTTAPIGFEELARALTLPEGQETYDTHFDRLGNVVVYSRKNRHKLRRALIDYGVDI